MDSALVDPQALDEAVRYSGGVFREMARILRTAIGRARRRKAALVENADVEWAVIEIRNEYRRYLDDADRRLLREVHQHNRLEYHERLRPLYEITQACT